VGVGVLGGFRASLTATLRDTLLEVQLPSPREGGWKQALSYVMSLLRVLANRSLAGVGNS